MQSVISMQAITGANPNEVYAWKKTLAAALARPITSE